MSRAQLRPEGDFLSHSNTSAGNWLRGFARLPPGTPHPPRSAGRAQPGDDPFGLGGWHVRRKEELTSLEPEFPHPAGESSVSRDGRPSAEKLRSTPHTAQRPADVRRLPALRELLRPAELQQAHRLARVPRRLARVHGRTCSGLPRHKSRRAKRKPTRSVECEKSAFKKG